MKAPEMISHSGKKIYYMDFSVLRHVGEIEEIIKTAKEHIRNQPLGSTLTLSNIDGMHFNSEIKGVFADFVSGNKPHIKASAVVGLSVLSRIVYN